MADEDEMCFIRWGSRLDDSFSGTLKKEEKNKMNSAYVGDDDEGMDAKCNLICLLTNLC